MTRTHNFPNQSKYALTMFHVDDSFYLPTKSEYDLLLLKPQVIHFRNESQCLFL